MKRTQFIFRGNTKKILQTNEQKVQDKYRAVTHNPKLKPPTLFYVIQSNYDNQKYNKSPEKKQRNY